MRRQVMLALAAFAFAVLQPVANAKTERTPMVRGPGTRLRAADFRAYLAQRAGEDLAEAGQASKIMIVPVGL
jgi:hypothetical protein